MKAPMVSEVKINESVMDISPSVDPMPWALPFGKPIYDSHEIDAVVQALRDGEIATGRIVSEFEQSFAELVGRDYAIACSSGSSANLIALATMMALGRAKLGDRVIVAGVTFITAISPVTQLGLVPVFVDTPPGQVNVDLNLVEMAIASTQAVGMLIPHTLGQPIDVSRLREIKHNTGAFLIEDCCESLGAASEGCAVGSASDLSTYSFYAGHHLTTGEGGMLTSADRALYSMAKSLRAFGRDHEYDGARFAYPVDDRPLAPDERYIHVRLGFNGKMTDFQAAIGLVQLSRLDVLGLGRRTIGEALLKVFEAYSDLQILGEPLGKGSSPFGLPLLAPSAKRRNALARCLSNERIEVRGVLGASSAHQPCFDYVPKVIFEPYVNAMEAGRRGLLIGCPPGLKHAAAIQALSTALSTWSQER